MSRGLAPVALFVFNRPDHTRRTIESLLRCAGSERSPLVVFADGPRGARDEAAVQTTRQVVRETLGDRAALRTAPANRGLSASIVGGVQELLAEHGRVIVVEDDLLLAPAFLAFMNDGLDCYAAHEQVYQLSGHMFDVPEFRHRREAVLLPLTTTWGWATWSRAWRAFDPVATGWQRLKADRSLRQRFNLDGTYDYAHMLETQMSGQRQSWGIRWYWSVFDRDGMGCFPPRSLVSNQGMDGSGTHGRGRLRGFASQTLADAPAAFVEPPAATIEPDALRAVRAAVWRQNGGWLGAGADAWRRWSFRARARA